jgi:hypothetical protein
MSNIIGGMICAIRNFIEHGFRSLPTILAGTTLVLGLTQGNLNFIFFFIGLAMLSPTATLVANILFEFIFSKLSSFVPQELWSVKGGDSVACAILPLLSMGKTPEIVSVVPSYWLTIMTFFYGYLFTNAYNLYTMQSDSKAPEENIARRKSQALMSMNILIAVAILTIIFRYMTACETGLGVLFSVALGGSLSYGWYKFMRNCGLGRLDDLFGISNRILPYQSLEDTEPTVCVPDSK